MVSILKSTWAKINDFLVSINSIHDLDAVKSRIMAGLEGLIPYESSGVLIKVGCDLKPMVAQEDSIRIDKRWAESFNEYYYKIGVFPDLDHNVFSSNFRDAKHRNKNEYVNDYILPQHIQFSAGLIITSPGIRPPVFLVLNRTKSERMFTREELTALKIIQPHISSHFHLVEQLEQFRKMPILLSEIEMNSRVVTGRESEIIYLILKRYTPAEIAKELKISILTVRKHIQNIYGKLEVTDKQQLFQKIKLDFGKEKEPRAH
jgi:DNA-binding CsgD family transcriptional regulator